MSNEYSLSYYKRGVRRKGSFEVININAQVARFLYSEDMKEYIRLFGYTVSPLMSDEAIDQLIGYKQVGVFRNKSGRVVATSLDIDTNDGQILGDLSVIDLKEKDIRLAQSFGIPI